MQHGDSVSNEQNQNWILPSHCVVLNKANELKVLLYALNEHDVFLCDSADERIKLLHLEDQHSKL